MKQYLKNSELAEIYKVSDDTITNWVKAARNKKVGLQIVEEKGRTYVVNTPNNHSILQTLSQKAKKYKNKRNLKEITVSKEFYEIFTERQIINIISNLESRKQIPDQYFYFGKGSEQYNSNIRELLDAKNSNFLTNPIDLLDSTLDYLFTFIRNHKKVNVVDLGVSNGAVAKTLLEFVRYKGILNKYIAISYNEELANISKLNVKSWLEKIPVETYVRSIQTEQIEDVLFKNSDSANIILLNENFNEGTLMNIRKSMGVNDILVFIQKLDSLKSRLSFSPLNQYKNLLSLMGLEEQYYEFEQIYDESKGSNITRIRLKSDIDLSFETKDFQKNLSFFVKEEIVLNEERLWEYPEFVYEIEMLDFEILGSMKEKSGEVVLGIARITNP